MENHVISCSTEVWLLPYSQHLFFNTSNLVTSSLHQYLEWTREPELPFCRCARLGCALQGQEWRSSPPGTVLSLSFIPYASRREGADSSGMSSWCLWASREGAVKKSCDTSERAGLIYTQTWTSPRAGKQQRRFHFPTATWMSCGPACHSLLCSYCLSNTSKIPNLHAKYLHILPGELNVSVEYNYHRENLTPRWS